MLVRSCGLKSSNVIASISSANRSVTRADGTIPSVAYTHSVSVTACASNLAGHASILAAVDFAGEGVAGEALRAAARRGHTACVRVLVGSAVRRSRVATPAALSAALLVGAGYGHAAVAALLADMVDSAAWVRRTAGRRDPRLCADCDCTCGAQPRACAARANAVPAS